VRPDEKWDGRERRRDNDDHDTLIALGVKVSNHAEAIKAMTFMYDQDQKDTGKRFQVLERVVYIGFGIILALEFAITLYFAMDQY